MAYAPPTGSTVLATPVSCASTCWVRRANNAACFGGQRQRFIQRIRVQRLAASQHRGQRLYGDAHDIIFRLLGGER